VRQHTRAQAAAAARDFRHDGVNAVGGGAGHQADKELGGAFGLARSMHWSEDRGWRRE
jgi:hypothetical protein